MKIILAGFYPEGTLRKFQSLAPGFQWLEAKTQEEYDAITEGDCIIVRVLKTTKKTMKNKPSLKAVIRWGVGYDSVDVAYADSRGIHVAVTPGVNAYAVAELAVALMLDVGRCISLQNQLTHKGTWNNKLHADSMRTLNKKIVGIIGGGNIGRRVARQVQSFGAKTIYYDAVRLGEATEAEYAMKYVSLEALLTEADIVTLHVPLLESTYHMIGFDQLQQMKQGAILINTARGGLVDDLALAEALRSGKLAGAGLDCVENEDLENNPLLQAENVVITPHMGGTTTDLADEMIPAISQQLLRLKQGIPLNHIVNQNTK